MLRDRCLPDQRDPYMEKLLATKANSIMATDALRGLDFIALCDVVEAAIEARPDVDQKRLAELARTLDRRAWEMMKPE